MSIRIVIAIMLAALLLMPASVVVAGGETDATIRITISPVNGDPGTDIAVTGEGARAGIPVQVMIVANGDTGEGEIARVEVTPAEDGTFSATIEVPEGTADGSYAVRAEQRNEGGGLIHYWWVGFQVGGGDALLPETGTLPGTSITITAILAALLVSVLIFQGIRRALRH
ncbi:MAG: hypothetical protein Kow0063_29950 [Anaerolineae bacterium]